MDKEINLPARDILQDVEQHQFASFWINLLLVLEEQQSGIPTGPPVCCLKPWLLQHKKLYCMLYRI